MRNFIKGVIATSLLTTAWLPTTATAQEQCEATEIIDPTGPIGVGTVTQRVVTPQEAATSAGGCFLAGRAAAILSYQPDLQSRRTAQTTGNYATQAGDMADTQVPLPPLWVSIGGGVSELEGAELEQIVATMGGDLFFNETTIFGLILQSDVAYQEGPSNTSFDATGIMAGLYAIFINGNLAFDARLMGGGSSTDIDEPADKVENIESTRWLAAGQVTNQVDIGGGQYLVLHLSVAWFEDTMESYTINSILVPEKTVRYGQADAGATWYLPVTLRGSDGSILLGASGIMGFGEAAGKEVPDEPRGRLDVGLELYSADAWSVSAVAFTDGLGQDNFEVYGADLGITIWF